MRWKRLAASASRSGSAPAESRQQRIAAELEERGVSGGVAERISECLASFARRNEGELEALLDGVALACRVQGDVSEELARNARDLQEIERLMGAFAGELAKLDEVLEVLAAYLRRMRTAMPTVATRMLQ